MSTTKHKTPRSRSQALFFRDLASPVSARRQKFSRSGQAAAVPALWRENFGGSDLPPPPVFTLEDMSAFSPESGIPDYQISPESKSNIRTPIQASNREFSTPLKSKSEASTSYVLRGVQQNQLSSTGLSWWSPTTAKSGGEQDEKGGSSPVEGVVQPGALITLPPQLEVARPEIQRNSLPVGNLNEEEWVTVYGFSPGDTNLVLREFEKCGEILKHVPGPRDANWMHILYQNRSYAQKALNKNGMQLNGVLIVGVKPLDPMQRQALGERLNHQNDNSTSRQTGGAIVSPTKLMAYRMMDWLFGVSARDSESSTLKAPSRPYHLQNDNSTSHQTGGAIVSPAKLRVYRMMDWLFGVSARDSESRWNPAGAWGYMFQIIFQTSAGAVMLTDLVFWLVIYPFMTAADFRLHFFDVCMHSVNALFLLGDTALNCMRFPMFRFAYFILWTGIFVIFQWIIHACVSLWWPYPFLDLSSPYAPLWYFAVGVMHIPCYGAFALVVRLKHLWLSRTFPETCQFIR